MPIKRYMNGDLSESILRPRRIIERQFREVSSRLAPWFRLSNTRLKYIVVCRSGLNRVFEADVIVDDDLKEVKSAPDASINVVSIESNQFNIQIVNNKIGFNRIKLMRLANPVQGDLDRALNCFGELEEALSDSRCRTSGFSFRSLPSYKLCCDLFFPKSVPIGMCQFETISESDAVVNGVGTLTVRFERRGLQALVLETNSALGCSERWGLLFVYWHGLFPPPLPVPSPGQ